MSIYIMTKIPVTEELLKDSFSTYLNTNIKWGEQYPNFKNINISNDHPFEQILGGPDGSVRPDLFPSVTIISSNDGEVPGMGKNWEIAELDKGDIDDSFKKKDWYLSATSLAAVKEHLTANNVLYGIQHTTTWRDNVSFEIWAENLRVKNDLYNLILGYLTGPEMIQLHKDTNVVIFTNTIQGQRSGYYNFDVAGRTLYGARFTMNVDYPVLQVSYDTTVTSREIIGKLVAEVRNG
jgi:hypothetical protein